MKLNSQADLEQFAFTSKRVFVFFLACFLFSGLLSTLVIFLEIDAPVVDWMARMLLAISFVILAVSWITPTVLMAAGAPELALAWLRGMNWIGPSAKPWRLLSSGERASIYFAVTLLPLL